MRNTCNDSVNSIILSEEGDLSIEEGFEEIQRKQESRKEFTDISSQARYYYSLVFAADDTTKIDPQSHQDHQYLSNKKKRTQFIIAKEKEQFKLLEEINHTDEIKFQAILQLLKFFSRLKKKVKVDYYSNKTFFAIKSASSQQIQELLKVFRKLYSELMASQEKQESSTKIRQFLIIPRFLISKEKIQQFVRDQEIQESFLFLAQNICLGHENNQANKKMPDKNLISLLKDLLNHPNGKELFKTICSINHGNKYKIQNGNNAYTQLYSKTLEQLKAIDRKIKRGNKKQTQASQSNNFSDDEFIPELKHSKCKIKSRNSLNLQETEICIKTRRIKTVKSLDDTFQIQKKDDEQKPHQQSDSLIKPFQIIDRKIRQNIILIFPNFRINNK